MPDPRWKAKPVVHPRLGNLDPLTSSAALGKTATSCLRSCITKSTRPGTSEAPLARLCLVVSVNKIDTTKEGPDFHYGRVG